MPTDSLSRTFAALSHPARRAMLARLGRGEASVKELARPLRMSAPAVTKHLKVLESSGLISRGRDAQWRPCRLETAPLVKATHWIDQLRKEWEERFDRLEHYLDQLQAPLPPSPPPPVATSPTPRARRQRKKGHP